MTSAQQPPWKALSEAAQQNRDSQIPSYRLLDATHLPAADEGNVMNIPRDSGLLTAHELEITETGATGLVKKIHAGEWSAEEVCRAFCKRAALAQQLTNCLTVIMFSAALERAKQLDAIFQQTGKVIGPLHGLPISLKDNFNIPGYPSSVGFCQWATEPMQTESTIVRVLRELGAVFYVKTNVPTAMMIAESVNNVYGRTVNPRNRATTSGGSSGGESALIALMGSPLGVGTDIGGSLRIPAACTGIYTLRPSTGRFPHFDARTGLSGQEAIGSVQGPMARSIADLRLWSQHVVGAEPWLLDPKCIEIPWRTVEIPSKPRIAVIWNDGVVHPTPPVTHALRTTVAQLQSKGYTIVDWPIADHTESFDLMGKFFVADGGKSVREILEPVSEPWRPEMSAYANAEEMGVHTLWKTQAQRTKLQKRCLDLWKSLGDIDAILAPTTPYASCKNGEFRYVGYTSIFNILDYSAVSFPTKLVADRQRDVWEPDFQSFGDLDTQIHDEYDPEVVHGLPISLQLVGRRLQEERILALVEKVESDLS